MGCLGLCCRYGYRGLGLAATALVAGGMDRGRSLGRTFGPGAGSLSFHTGIGRSVYVGSTHCSSSVLAPEAGNPGGRRQDEFLVMKFVYGKTSALLEGDAERKSEPRVAPEQPGADLLKVAHHGSATATIPQLRDAVHPHFVVISSGTRNTYSHPRGRFSPGWRKLTS